MHTYISPWAGSHHVSVVLGQPGGHCPHSLLSSGKRKGHEVTVQWKVATTKPSQQLESGTGSPQHKVKKGQILSAGVRRVGLGLWTCNASRSLLDNQASAANPGFVLFFPTACGLLTLPSH